MHVYDTVVADSPGNNPNWYRVYGGYMNASRLQKVRVQYNQPLTSVPETKLVAEITVPYTQGYRYNQRDGWYPFHRLYYSATQWVVGVDTGPDGKPWYIVQHEADRNIQYYVPAEQLRIIQPEEFTPLSPEVTPTWEKRIDVDLTSQTVTCTEYGQVVHTAIVSTGLRWLFDTPTGDFFINNKLPSRNMSSSSPLSDDVIPLIGVPWTCFFNTGKGHAFHGTYWHDNFGVTMSHGCVNMRNEDAKWLFRWCYPTAAFDEIDKTTLARAGQATPIHIHN
jgi:lipoprotein-anchoring transpeptidase ErfK/SrfK